MLKAYHLREMKDKPKEIIHHCVERWEKSALSQEINNLDKIINYILLDYADGTIKKAERFYIGRARDI